MSNPFRSQTWEQLSLLLQELPPKRVRFLVFVLVASFCQGLLDILLVGLLARMVDAPCLPGKAADRLCLVHGLAYGIPDRLS